jgi:hypothetical protein
MKRTELSKFLSLPEPFHLRLVFILEALVLPGAGAAPAAERSDLN